MGKWKQISLGMRALQPNDYRRSCFVVRDMEDEVSSDLSCDQFKLQDGEGKSKEDVKKTFDKTQAVGFLSRHASLGWKLLFMKLKDLKIWRAKAR